MERISLNAYIREGRGKGAARSLRRSGYIPAVLYNKGESTAINLDLFKAWKLVSLGHAENTLIDLKIEGATDKVVRTTILRDYQTDPVAGKLLHIDFLEISMDEKIRVTVPVELTTDTPEGVKKGGLLQLVTRDLDLECLPSLIPDNVLVDASKLDIGDILHAGDIKVEEGIKLITNPEQVVLTIAQPVSQEKLEELLTTPSPIEEVKEPEIIKKPAKETEEAE